MLKVLAMSRCETCLYENLCWYEKEFELLKKMEKAYSFLLIDCKFFRPMEIELEECTEVYTNKYI